MANQAGQALTWDIKDNLLTRNGVTYFYDGNETRRAKTGKRYVINELNNSVLAETDEAGNYLFYYVYGPTGLLYRPYASGGTAYYHYDFRGSTIALTDDGQNTFRLYQYDAYGKILQQSSPANDDNPFRYVGQHGVQYEDANLYFMRARYYDPTTGKFLSEDPIWSTNLFAYGDNNPMMGIDPSGRITLKGTISKMNEIRENVVTSLDAMSSFIADYLPKNSEAEGINGMLGDVLTVYTLGKSGYEFTQCKENTCKSKNSIDFGITAGGAITAIVYSDVSGISAGIYVFGSTAGDINTLYHYGFEGPDGLDANGSLIYKGSQYIGEQSDIIQDKLSKIQGTPQWWVVKIANYIKSRKR